MPIKFLLPVLFFCHVSTILCQNNIFTYYDYLKKNAVYKAKPGKVLEDGVDNYWLSDQLIQSVKDTMNGEKTEIHVSYRDGSSFVFNEQILSHKWQPPHFLMYQKSDRSHHYINLKTKKSKSVKGTLVSVFEDQGIEYTVTQEKQLYLLHDQNGLKLTESYTPILLCNGFAIFAIHHDYKPSSKAAMHLATKKIIGKDDFMQVYLYTTRYIAMVDKDDNCVYYNNLGDSIFKGKSGSMDFRVYSSSPEADDLVVIRNPDNSHSLMTYKGKFLGKTAVNYFIYQPYLNTPYFNIEGLGYCIYDPVTESITSYQNEFEMIAPDTLLSHANSNYFLMNNQGKILHEFPPLDWLRWFPTEHGGIFFGGIIEPDKKKRKEKLKIVNELQESGEYLDEGFIREDPDVWKYFYFDKKGNPIQLNGEYHFTDQGRAHHVFTSTYANPHFFGIMDEHLNIVKPENYLYIEYYKQGDYFIALNKQMEIEYLHL